jgi:osmotically inducible lipoprotein OsmB
MKKYITTFVMMVMLAISIPMLSGTAAAQSYGVSRPNIYNRHRKAVNIGGGALAGALLGALLGGKKGALIGAAVGAAGGAIVTKKQAPRNYYRYGY